MNINQAKPILLIGSMKCGTSKLYDFLAQHPEICPCKMKEPQYFSEHYYKYKTDNKSYESFFNFQKDGHKYLLDGSTGYTKYPSVKGVPQRIKDYNLNPNFIMIVRNPFDRIRSHYNFMRGDLKWKDRITSSHLINTSKYFLQLEQYCKVFPDAKILVVTFEKLKENPINLCNEIFSFINAAEFKIDTESSSYRNKTIPVNIIKIKVDNILKQIGIYSIPIFKKVCRGVLNVILRSEYRKVGL